MPLYSYVCKKCGNKFDLLIGVTSGKPEIKCKECGSKDVERALEGFSVGKSGGKDCSGPSCSSGNCPLG